MVVAPPGVTLPVRVVPRTVMVALGVVMLTAPALLAARAPLT